MKRMFSLTTVLSIGAAFVISITPAARAEGSAASDPRAAYKKIQALVDVLDLDHLSKLQSLVNDKIFASDEWSEATIPAGIYKVGVDLPAGHWTFAAIGPYSTPIIQYYEKSDDTGMFPNPDYRYFMQSIVSEDMLEYSGGGASQSIDIDLTDGWYFQTTETIKMTPYAGKNITFK